MKLRILSWNIRRATDSNKKMVIKSLIKSQRVDLVCLQETKIMSSKLVRSLGSGKILRVGCGGF